MAAIEWFRLWHDMPNDPKWRTIARISGQPIATVLAVALHLMVDASRNVTRGHVTVTAEDVASALDVTDEAVEAIFSAMQGRVLDGERLSGWDKRQPKREDLGNPETGVSSSAERKRAQRARERMAREEAASRSVTQRHAESREVTLDKDTDKDIPSSLRSEGMDSALSRAAPPVAPPPAAPSSAAPSPAAPPCRPADAAPSRSVTQRHAESRSVTEPVTPVTANVTPVTADVTDVTDVTPVTHPAAPKAKRRAAAAAIARPDEVPEQAWQDWLRVRQAKRAPLTQTALDAVRREADKAGITLADAVRCCAEAGWQGFDAGWYANRRAANSVGGSAGNAVSVTRSGRVMGIHSGFDKVDYGKGVMKL